MILISGGQTGADQGALLAAKTLGLLPCEGWVPRGWKTDTGPAPWLAEYGLKEHPIDQYRPRTIANVRMADTVIWFGNDRSPGGILTLGEARRSGIIYLTLEWPTARSDVADLVHARCIHSWLYHPDGIPRFERVMIAGNRERMNPGIGTYVQYVLEGALR